MNASPFTKIIFVVLLFPLCIAAQTKDTFLVFYLGGQSNMDGYGYNKDLPSELDQTFKDTWIFHGNPTGDENPAGGLGIWAPLQPGHGVGFSSDGHSNQLSDRFGVELSFIATLKKQIPNQKIALIKYSRGGSSIDSLAAGQFGSWEPDFIGKTGLNQYDYFLRTVNRSTSISDINGDGQEDFLKPAGILWMQGESDAHTEVIANRYYSNLKRLMDLIRATLRTDDLPIVLGKISDSWNDKKDGKVWDYGELVQHAQEKFARQDRHTSIVRSTRYYKYSDPWHYDSAGYMDLGEKFAEAILGELK